jgi:hypothetical protein
VGCSFGTLYYKILTLFTHIYIFPQNCSHWPLCESAKVGITAGKTAERYLQDGPNMASLVAVTVSPAIEIDAHIAFLSSKNRKRNRMVQD